MTRRGFFGMIACAFAARHLPASEPVGTELSMHSQTVDAFPFDTPTITSNATLGNTVYYMNGDTQWFRFGDIVDSDKW